MIPTQYEVPADEVVSAETPDVEQSITVTVDAKRTKVGDPSGADAVWVCLVAPTFDDLTDPEAKSIALRYVQRVYGRADGIDAADGPRVDDGRGPLTLAGSELGGGVLSAAQYLQMAAQQNATRKLSTQSRFCYFVRVRRHSGV